MDPRRAIRPAAVGVDGGDLRRWLLVRPGVGRDPAARPPRVRRPGAPQHPAQDGDRLGGPLRAAGSVPAHTVPCAQEVATFWRIARPCWSIRTSRGRRRRSSCSSLVRSPGRPRPASLSAWRSQLRSASDETSRSAAGGGSIARCCGRGVPPRRGTTAGRAGARHRLPPHLGPYLPVSVERGQPHGVREHGCLPVPERRMTVHLVRGIGTVEDRLYRRPARQGCRQEYGGLPLI